MIKICQLLRENEKNREEENEENSNNIVEDSTHSHLSTELDLNLKMDTLAEKIIQTTPVIQLIRCSAHTLQLAVQDALKLHVPQIAKAKEACKKLCTPTFLALLKKMNYKKPLIDVPTRWNSTHDMLQRLLELKDFCADMAPTNKELHLVEDEWNFIESTVNSLQPAKQATMEMQKENIVLGDYYGIWWRCKKNTEKIDTSIALVLCQSMLKREKNLFQNNAFLAALFLDYRYQCILTEQQKEAALMHLINTWQLMNSLNTKATENRVNASKDMNASKTEELLEQDELENMLKSQYQLICQKNMINLENKTNMRSLLNACDGVQRIHCKSNILDYWETQRSVNYNLYQLAKVVQSVPATQVSVERSFFGLRFILSNLRASIKEDILENFMIIRGNGSIKPN